MLTLKPRPSPKVVCIGAHCDDIEIGCGGTLAALAQAWPDAHFHCWVFSGNAVREQESRRCLALLLGPERFTLQVFGHRDGYFPAEWSQIKQFRGPTILEYEIVKFDGDLGRTNFYVPLTNAQLTAKVDALMMAFASQAGRAWFTRSTFEAIARLRGVESNSANGLAEAFYARKSVVAMPLPARTTPD
jgi:LmbE family N-acetylglucosaminyl deacetylase